MWIGELAARTGVSERSLRHYERLGLVAAQRDDNGYRRYSSDAVRRVRRIRQMMAYGFRLAEIQRLAPCLDELDARQCRDANKLYRAKLAEIDGRIADLGETRARLNDAIAAVTP